MKWLDRAACVGEDPDLFFPVSRSGPAVRDALAAKRICCRCPVAADCLDWALRTRQLAGVWGGTSEEERAELIRTGRAVS